MLPDQLHSDIIARANDIEVAPAQGHHHVVHYLLAGPGAIGLVRQELRYLREMLVPSIFK